MTLTETDYVKKYIKYKNKYLRTKKKYIYNN